MSLTMPRFEEETSTLVKTAARLSHGELRKLMGISESLAELTYQRFQALASPQSSHKGEGHPALLTFAGDVYRTLDAPSLSSEELLYAQDHLRLLSGLYGVLRPLDTIKPYRLEMGTRLKTTRGHDLYDFWGPRPAQSLNADLQHHKARFVLNLASQEYFKAVDLKTLSSPVITCAFEEVKEGRSRPLMIFVKRARGLMARWCLQNRPEKPEDLQGFDLGGYQYRPGDSTDQVLMFKRAQPEPKRKGA